MSYYDSESAYGDSSYGYDQKVERGDWFWNGQDWYWVNFASSGYDSSSDEDASSGYYVQTSGESSSSDEDSSSDEQSSGEGWHQALIVFDWDDTLLPTTFLQNYFDLNALESSPHGDYLTRKHLKELRQLESNVLSLLQRANRLGTVKIVTNGGEGWVEYSCMYLMPSVYHFVNGNSIEIISARSLHEGRYPDTEWPRKERVFADEVRYLLQGSIARPHNFSFVSIGDGEHERYAAKSLIGTIPKHCVKVVVLQDDPTLAQAATQIAGVESHLDATVWSQKYAEFSV